jgi:hypothetical protein
MRNAVLLLIYGIAIFGIIDTIPDELKETPRLIYIVVLYCTFVFQLVIIKRIILIDLLLLTIVLLSSIGFCIFTIDLVVPPQYTALDCQGHRETVLHGGLGFLVGIFLTAVLSYFFIKEKIRERRLDKLCSIVAIAVLTCCVVKMDIIMDLNRSIDEVSMPKFVLPKGC